MDWNVELRRDEEVMLKNDTRFGVEDGENMGRNVRSMWALMPCYDKSKTEAMPLKELYVYFYKDIK